MFFGAIDIGGTKTIVAVCNEKGQILQMEKFPTENPDWREHFKWTRDKFIECVDKHSLDMQKDISGIGINVPGLVDREGNLVYAPHQNWRNVAVKKFFADGFHMDKIVVENDVNACAVGELMFGGGGTDFLWITISTGNGGAIVTNGNLVRGNNNCAGEFGHLKVEYEAPKKCKCGQYGCLEAYSSGTAIKEEFEAVLIKDFDFGELMINKQFLDDELQIDPKGLSILAREGNPIAINIFNKVGLYLGRAISYGLNISNPKTVYLGGGISESLDLILPSIEIELEKCALNECSNVEICRTKLGYNAAIIGAAAVAMRKYLVANG